MFLKPRHQARPRAYGRSRQVSVAPVTTPSFEAPRVSAQSCRTVRTLPRLPARHRSRTVPPHVDPAPAVRPLVRSPLPTTRLEDRANSSRSTTPQLGPAPQANLPRSLSHGGSPHLPL